MTPAVCTRMSTCTFWITRKNRTCKMQVKIGALYCAEHLTSASDKVVVGVSVEDERIPCPLDPAHSVYRSKLTKHLKKCNARSPAIMPTYYKENCNLISENKQCDSTNTTELINTSVLAKRVLEAAQKLLPESIKTRLNDESCSGVSETEKHRVQQAALAQKILATVDAEALLVFVEMGAGKGGLSSYLWETHIRDTPLLRSRSKFLLIDRSNSRCKKDAKMKHEGAAVERIFIDIKDLDLAALVAEKFPEGAQCLFISKHLCGAATCLTLNALKGLLGAKGEMKITLAVALCCHQCCAWNAYPNRSFLKENNLSGSEEEFKKLKAMTSWAVCGRIKEEFDWSSDAAADEELVDEEEEVVDSRIDNSKDLSEEVFDSPLKKKVKLSPENSKREIGRLTKRLLDWGRLLALQEAGFEGGELGHYVAEEITLENALLFTTIN